MLDKNFPLEVTIDRHESTSVYYESEEFVIYLKVQNKSSDTQNKCFKSELCHCRRRANRAG